MTYIYDIHASVYAVASLGLNELVGLTYVKTLGILMKRAQNTQVLSFDIITLTKKYSTVNYRSKLWFKGTFIYYGKSMVLLKTMELRFAREKDIVDYQKLRHFHL